MARPDPLRLDPATYPHSDTIQTRFQDLDPLGHINNVAMAALFESARVRFNQKIGLMAFRAHRFLIGKVEIQYLAEGRFPADVVISTGVGRIGTRSWDILAVAHQNGVAVATCDVVLVMSAEGGATELPAELRAVLEHYTVRPD